MRAKPPMMAELCVAPPLVRPSGRLRRGDTLGAGALGLGRGFASLALFPLRSNRAFLQRARMGLPTPPRRARCNECTSLVSKVALCALRGGSRSVVCSSAVNVCFAFLTDFARGRGRRGRRGRPKPSAALFRLSKLAVKVPRSVFRLRRASPPYPLELPLRGEAGGCPR